jgi:hypothetical protein
MAMSEAIGPKFRFIGKDAGDCMVRYCFENAEYLAIWNRTMTSKKETMIIKRAVCHSHREAIESKPWNEVSEIFRYTC